VWLAWAAAAFVLIATALQRGIVDMTSTDDAMRLVEVHDLLAGQSWFDLTQYRLDPPYGVAMHWSRIVDLPLALLIGTVRLFASAEAADAVALYAWPLALLAVLFLVLARVMDAIGFAEARLPAIVLLATATPVLNHFRPGAIDHHGLQLALTLAALLLALRSMERPRDAAAAGALGGVTLAVGLEMMPALVAIGIVIAFRWIVSGRSHGRRLRAYGLSLALSAIVFGAVFIGPMSLIEPVCDALARPLIVLLLLSGGGIALATLVPDAAGAWVRLGMAGLIAVGALASVAGSAPQCFASPYEGLDPTLTTYWLDNVAEALSFRHSLSLQPQTILACYGLPLLGLAFGLVAMRRFPHLGPKLALASAALGVQFAVSLWEYRGVAGSLLFAIPFLAKLVTMIASRVGLTEPRRIVLASVLVSPALLTAGATAAIAAFPGSAAPGAKLVYHSSSGCDQADAADVLRRIPAGNVLSTIDLGPMILVRTAHSVYAAPYHRNVQGNLFEISMLASDLKPSGARLSERGVASVALCPDTPEVLRLLAHAPSGLAARLLRGEAVPGLEPLPTAGSSLRLWTVRPERE
jgi:hypothetical protein